MIVHLLYYSTFEKKSQDKREKKLAGLKAEKEKQAQEQQALPEESAK